MNKPLWLQILVILVLGLVLAFLNNMRSSAKIEWVKNWPDYSEVSAREVLDEAETPTETTAEPEAEVLDEAAIQARAEETMQMVSENLGLMTDISLPQAHRIFTYAKDFTLWIDARSPELFEEGRITGSHLLYLYDKHTYLDSVQATIAEQMPLALVVYCKGKECTDSHVLAEELFNLGHDNVFIYKDGYDDWYKAGYPIEGTAVEPAVATAEGAPITRELEEKPPGMYLEHIVRDMLPFLLGLVLALNWRRARDHKGWFWMSVLMLGGFFIWAALPKLVNPFLFAKNIWNYDIAPGSLINFSALYMPSIELLAGLALITGLFRRGGAMIVGGLLVIFIIAVSFNVLRGHEFNCGCTSTGTLITDLYFAGWNEKFLLLLRDAGLLIMAVVAFRRKNE